MEKDRITIVECPRDAMQGWKSFIPTQEKIRYINTLLKVGFHTIDFGSFVSPKAIPQMADTVSVLSRLELSETSSRLLAIVANERGALQAAEHNEITYLGFPFSISETFQLRNTNSTIAASLGRVDNIQEICIAQNKQLVIYLSMGFGNPYGDPYDEGILLQWANEMVRRGISIISLADTVGIATPAQIRNAFSALVPRYSDTIFGVHLHSSAENRREKMEAALDAGCRRFDGAIAGIGGCPMAQDELVGNMPTEFMVNYFEERGLSTAIDKKALLEATALARQIFM